MSTIRNILKKLILFSVIMTCLFCFYSCNNRVEEVPYGTQRKIPLSVAAIRKYTQETFFNKDGTARKEIWVNAYKGSDGLNPVYDYQYEEITGFDVQIIKSETEKYDRYLVEFEPTGCLYGSVWYDYECAEFTYRQSPFKILDIDKDNRYVCDPMNDHKRLFSTKIDGVIVGISEIAWAGVEKYLLKIYESPENVYYAPVYDITENGYAWREAFYEKKGDTYVEYKKDWE